MWATASLALPSVFLISHGLSADISDENTLIPPAALHTVILQHGTLPVALMGLTYHHQLLDPSVLTYLLTNSKNSASAIDIFIHRFRRRKHAHKQTTRK